MTNTDKDKFTAIAHDDDFRNGYASRTTWAEILEPHGWVLVRPGKSGGRYVCELLVSLPDSSAR